MYAGSSSSTRPTNLNPGFAATSSGPSPQQGSLQLTATTLYRQYSDSLEGYRWKKSTDAFPALVNQMGIYSPSINEKGTRKQCEMLHYLANETTSHLGLPFSSKNYHEISTEFATAAKAPKAIASTQSAMSKAINLSLIGAGYDFIEGGSHASRPEPGVDFARMGGRTPFAGKKGFSIFKVYDTPKDVEHFTSMLSALKSKCGPLLQEQAAMVQSAKANGHLAYAEQIVHHGKLILIGSDTDALANNPAAVSKVYSAISRIDSTYKGGKTMSMAELQQLDAAIFRARPSLLPNLSKQT